MTSPDFFLFDPFHFRLEGDKAKNLKFKNLLASGSFEVKHTSIYHYLPFDVMVPSTSKQLKKTNRKGC